MGDPDPLEASDSELLAQCRVETFRASGPGGQHRNKTDSAVRLTHTATGIVSQAFERRSQPQNRGQALHRLRRAIALRVRRAVEPDGFEPSAALLSIMPGSKPRIGPHHDAFWAGARDLLDVFVALDCSVSATAAALGLSTGACSSLLLCDPDLVAAVNTLRTSRGLRALRP